MAIDYASAEVFALSAETGTVAAGLGANSEIFQFRWTHASKKCRILQIVVEGAGSIAAFAAGYTRISARVARAWTGDGSGGTTITPAGNDNKRRTTQGGTQGAVVRIASTAGLTAGTKTLDGQDIGSVVSAAQAVAGTPVVPPQVIYSANNIESLPIVLDNQEGFVIRATVPATGTWTAGLSVVWAEAGA